MATTPMIVILIFVPRAPNILSPHRANADETKQRAIVIDPVALDAYSE